jgi:predicted phage-related endonuclease
MKTLHLIQGTEAWKQARLQYFCASEAPAMMGESKYQTRQELLLAKKTGLTPEVTPAQQALFDKGHAAEAAFRPIAEEKLGEELYPVTGAATFDAMELLASFDGLNMLGTIGFEHKLYSQNLAEQCRRGELEPHYYWQLEHQCLVAGMDTVFFVTSEGTEPNHAATLYHSQPERRAKLIAGWKQFAADLSTFEVPAPEQPKAIAEPTESLPSIVYKTSQNANGLALTSNIIDYKAAAQSLVEQSKKTLNTEQDFANAEARIKSCKTAEERLSVIRTNVLGEVADIDNFCKELATIAEMLRQCRLNDEKQVKTRKEAIRAEAIQAANNALCLHHAELRRDALLTKHGVTLDYPRGNYAEAIKGVKTLSSLHSKLADELAAAKVAATQLNDDTKAKLSAADEQLSEHKYLFPDIGKLILPLSPEQFVAIVYQRIEAHKAELQARIEAEAKRQAELLAQQAQAKAQAEARAQALAEAQAQAEAAHKEKMRQQVEDQAEVKRLAEAKRQAEQLAQQAKSPEQPQAHNSLFPTLAAFGHNDAAPEKPRDIQLSPQSRGVIMGLQMALDILSNVATLEAGIETIASRMESFLDEANTKQCA